MTAAAPTALPTVLPTTESGRRFGRVAIALLPFAVLSIVAKAWPGAFPDWARLLPDKVVLPFVDWINDISGWMRTGSIFGLGSVRDFTRTVSEWLNYPLELTEGLLIDGYDPLKIPAIPWVMLAGLLMVLGHKLGGWRLATLSGAVITYLALFDLWEDSMVTLSAVLVSAPVAALVGFLLGIAASRSRRFETVLAPFLNLMQALPHFSYLIAIAIFVSIETAGLVATIVYAFPPMARLTLLGLRSVPSEVREAGAMSGCSRRQMLWKVDIPAARSQLMVGVNQTIMVALGMVVLAAFVGQRGLGQKLLNFIERLEIGQALEHGMAIVLMAVVLDRLSQAAARRRPEHREPSGRSWLAQRPHLMAALAVVAVGSVLGFLLDDARQLGDQYAVSTSSFWDSIVDYIKTSWKDPLESIKNFVGIQLLLPMKNFFLAVPWFAWLALVAGVGWNLGKWRVAVPASLYVLFIAFSGFWVESMETLYLVTAAVVLSAIIGIPLGIWAAKTERRTSRMSTVLDFFQTLPSFIYLVPVIMLFRVGTVAALTAILVYSTVPAVRYTMLGIRNVPHDKVEAAITSGATPRQQLFKVKLPMALPEIMLGINQTIMFGLLMIMIAAFIGGINGLGDDILRARTNQDIGSGLVVGMCMAFLGLSADVLITRFAAKRKRLLGLDGPDPTAAMQ